MPALDLTTFDFALKEYYTDQKIEEIVYKKNPLLAMIPKMEKFFGDVLPVPVIYGNPQGRSSVLSTAITNNQATRGIKFNLYRARDYGVAKIDHETMKASANDSGAFLRASTTEIDGILFQTSRSLATALYGNGSGSVGQIQVAGGVATATITLERASDVTNFEVGQTLVTSATDGGTAVRAGSMVITGIDRSLGTLTGSAPWNDAGKIPAIAVGDYIFVQGDYDQKVKGLAGWLPSVAPSAAPWFGVDRTADVTRLGGVRFDGTLMPIEEAVIEIISRVEREGGAPDYIFMNHAQWRALEKSLGSKVQYVNPNAGGSANVGFKGLTVSGQHGPVTILADVNCPNNLAYCLQMDTWKLYSLGKAPTLFDTDGLSMLRGTVTDDLEVRVYYYAQFACRAPGYNGVLTLPVAA